MVETVIPSLAGTLPGAGSPNGRSPLGQCGGRVVYGWERVGSWPVLAYLPLLY